MQKLELQRFKTNGKPKRLVLTCDKEYRSKAALPLGASPLKGGKFSYPCDEVVVLVLKHLFDGELELDAECENWFNEAQSRAKHLEELASKTKAVAAEVKYETLKANLKPYQNVAVEWGQAVKRGIIADDRGLGKTLESITIVEAIEAKRVLVVCPSYLKYGWAREIEDWTPLEDAVILAGERSRREAHLKESARDKVKYTIVNYEMLRESKQRGGYPELLEQNWDCVFYDEGHRLCNRNNQWTMGAKKIKAPYQFVLTGNPISNMPDSIWGILNVLYPSKFTSYWAFVDYYCNTYDGFFGKEILGVKKEHLQQLQFTLRPIVLRRLKADVAPYLPEKIHKLIEIELEGPQKTFYKLAEKKMLLELEQGGWNIIDNVATLNLRLHQALANPAILGGKDFSVVEKATLELIQDLQASGEKKIIIGTRFKGSIELFKPKLDKAKIKYYVITGDVKSEERDRIMQEFKASEEPCILIGTIFAMSEGINADECDSMIFMGKSPRPLDNEQFADRIHRVTSTRIKNYYHIVVMQSVSEDQEVALRQKTAMQNDILSMEAIEKFVAERVKERSVHGCC